MQEIDFYLVDAFSESSFGGNPAAVCPLDAWLPDETLLRMAQQHNQSETAFFVCTKGGLSCAGSPRSPRLICVVTRRLPRRMFCLTNWIIRTHAFILTPLLVA